MRGRAGNRTRVGSTGSHPGAFASSAHPTQHPCSWDRANAGAEDIWLRKITHLCLDMVLTNQGSPKKRK